jgi:hypothetical protein
MKENGDRFEGLGLCKFCFTMKPLNSKNYCIRCKRTLEFLSQNDKK